MKKFLFSLFFILSINVFANEVKILFVIGDVKYYVDNNVFIVKTGDLIPLNAVVETGNKSVAIIGSDEFSIKLSSNTRVSVLSLLPNINVDFSNGKIWVKVNKLLSGNTFMVKTPTSNAGVRGTEFIYDIEDSDSHKLYVLEGSVYFGNKSVERLIEKGKVGILKKSGLDIRDFSTEDLVLAKSNLPSIIRFKDLKSYFEKNFLRKSLYKSIGFANRDRFFIGENRKTDFITGRTVTDEEGNVVRVSQTLRKLSDNTLQIVNITKKNNGFLNVLEYRGIYEDVIPTNIDGVMDIISGSSKERERIINIIQIDGIYTTRMKIYEDKSNPMAKVVQMGISNNLSEPSLSSVDYTKLKQVNETDPYLSANYTLGASSLVLKVYLLKEDGSIVPVYKDMELSSDFLMSMSFKFIFDDMTQIGGLITNPSGIYFHVLPDIGFMIINELVK
ncbi:MAG TPA: FecR family protein [Spirochaetota bacterium]|nr:FecR family protein [Spirochaetota bacterium]